MHLSRRQLLTGAFPNTDSAAPQTTSLYRQQIRHIPTLLPEHWTLTIKGGRWLVLQYDAVLEQDAIDLPCTLSCLGNMPGGNLIGHAVWRGVPLQRLLDQAGVLPNMRYAHFYGADGYITCLEVAQLTNALLVYQMNGEPLTPDHGFPARIIVPGLYGYKMPKWIMRIELSDLPMDGFWEARGWSADGTVQTNSAFLTPRSGELINGVVSLTGFAFAGEREITQVEVSVDDGAWTLATLESGSRFSWSHWYADWMPGSPGDYVLRVRATDSTGFTQSERASAKPFPNGSGGLHKIVVRVTD